jgi:hypothetical protein
VCVCVCVCVSERASMLNWDYLRVFLSYVISMISWEL